MTTDMQARDEKEFEAWLKTVDILRVPMNGKAAYMAALKAERARSAVLVEALEYYEGDGDHRTYLDIFDLIEVKGSVTSFDSEKFSKPATEALKAYRGESILGGTCTINPDVNFEEQL